MLIFHLYNYRLMKTPRLYQNTPLNINDELTLNPYASHHLLKVLRFPQGKTITLFNGDGANYTAKILKANKTCTVQILTKSQNPSESKLNLTLAQGIAKGDKMDFIIQKAVELGINKITPLFTERCIVRLKGTKLTTRHHHWQKIILNACEQSGRSLIPELTPPTLLTTFLQHPTPNTFVLHPLATQTLLTLPPLTQATLLIGPEGGLTPAEITQATQANYHPLLLNTRTLRTETASLAAIANMQLLWGN